MASLAGSALIAPTDPMHSRLPSASCCPLPSSLSSAAASCGNSSATWRQLQSSSSRSWFLSSHRGRRRLVHRASVGAAAPKQAPPPSTASLYAVLGVEKDVSMSSIKSAYRRLALRYHPDVAGDVEASTRKFLEVQEAYEILSDPERRADYDFSLMHPFCAHALSSNFHMRPPRRRRSSAGHSDSSVSSAWKLQWEAQISRLKQRRQGAQHPASAASSSSSPPPPSTSWGARVRWHNLSQDNPCPVCV